MGSCWDRRSTPGVLGAFQIGRAMETWGPVLPNKLECEERPECRKETCQSIRGEPGASESLLSRFSLPALTNEVWGETGQPQSPFLVPWWRARPLPRLTRLLPHQEKPELGSCPVRKSLFCIVRAPGEVKTWSCPDGGPRPHPENHKATAQACPCQSGHVSRSAAEPSHRAKTHRVLPANEALARSRLIRPPRQQELPPCKVTSILC